VPITPVKVIKVPPRQLSFPVVTPDGDFLGMSHEFKDVESVEEFIVPIVPAKVIII
jgi:hypothetical protein